MNELQEKVRLRHALDTTLSGLNGDPWLKGRVLQSAKGEQKVKKKLSLGFVLLIVLALTAATALAALTLNALYEQTMEKEGQRGLIRDWSATDQTALVDWMADAGVELNQEQVARLHDGMLTEEQQSALAMEIINGYYPARDGILTSVDIIAKEKGPLEYWTLEDKAWFSEMMLKYQPEEVSSVNLLPTEGDITQEQAIEIMYAYYEKEYGLKREDFDESRMAISFSEGTWDDGSGPERLKTWGMDLWLKNDPEHPLGISILPDGTIKQASEPHVATWEDDWYNAYMAKDFWTIEGLYRFDREWRPIAQRKRANGERLTMDLDYLSTLTFGLPGSGDITRDEAYAIARQAILDSGFSEDYLTLYAIREAYLLDASGNGIYKFCFKDWAFGIADERREKAEELHQQGLIPRRIVVCVNPTDGAVISIEQQNDTDGTARLGI